MVFFLLIVMVVFASFIIILNQNTGLEQTTVQAKQLDLDRYTELATVSVSDPEIAVLNQVVYISCSITNNGTLPTQLVRLWIRDITQNTVGNTIMNPSITLQPGTHVVYFNSSYVTKASSSDQFAFWFISTRGNTISAFPNTDLFNGLTQNGTFPGVTSINSTYQTNQNNPLQLTLTTTLPNQLIYVVVSFDDGNTMHMPTSTPSLTWSMRSQSLPTNSYLSQNHAYMQGDSILTTFYAIDPSVGPITINIQSTADELSDYYCSALAFAISNVNTTVPFDGSAQTTIGESAMPQDTITTHYSNELIIGALGIDNLNPSITPGAGFAQIMPVQSSYGASGEPDSMPRSVWTEWDIMQAPINNLSVNCTFTNTQDWAIIVDAVKLLVIPPTVPVNLSPSNGPIGQPVTVSGQGFAANSPLLAVFDGSQIPFSATTDSNGTIPANAIFTVPPGETPGNKTVTIIDKNFNYVNTTFLVTTPTITVSPTSGPVGTTITVTGSNFIDNSTININFAGNPTVTIPSPIAANPTGSFSATFNFNFNDSAGINQVMASDGINSAFANFNVIPSIKLNPTTGPIGSLVTVSGTGFAASQSVTVTFAGATVATIPVNVNTDGFGFFTANMTVPTGQTAGAKNVVVTDANSNSATTTFALIPSISLNPTSGNAGSTVTVSGSGFAPSSTLTATYAGSPITISGTTITNATGSFSAATFTVPLTTTGGAQTIVIKDASSNTANTIFTVNTLYQGITVALSNSAPSATVTVIGGYPSPNAFAADGTKYNIQMVAGAPFTLSFSNSGNTRDGFIFSNVFSATSSSYTSSTNAISVPAYMQVQNTLSVSFNGGNAGSSDSLALKGTFLGTGSYTIVTLTPNTWSGSAWSDYNTAITFPVNTVLSSTTQRWAINGAYSTAALTSGGNSYSTSYYHQYLQTLSYSVLGGGLPTAPTATGTSFGVAYAPSLTTTAAGYWFDATGSIAFGTSVGGAGEQWAPKPASVLATALNTQVVSMYHQYQVTASYSTSDASTPSASVILTGTALGSASAPTLTTSAQQVWLDAGTGWSVNTLITSGTQRWNAASGTSGAVSSAITVAPIYYHQYQQTFSYVVSGGGSPTAPTLTSTQSGGSYTPVLTGSAVGYWLDAGVSWAVTNPLGGSTGSQRWQTSQTVSGSVGSAQTVVFTYYSQYMITLSYSVVGGGSGYSAPSFTANAFGVSSPQTLTGSGVGYWFDAGSWSAINPLGGSSGSEQWTTTTGTGTISSSQTIVLTYNNQYYFTVNSAAGTNPTGQGWYNAGTTAASSVSASVNIVGPPSISYTSTGFTGTGNAPPSGSTTSVSFTINSASSVSWTWHGLMTLYPVADVSNGIATVVGASAHWQAVSDYAAADTAAYVQSTSAGAFTDYYTSQAHGSATGTINSVTANIRCLQTGTTGTAQTYLRLNGVGVSGAAWTVPSAYTSHSNILSRPGSGSWSWTDIDSLQSGVTLNRTGAATTIRCTLVWVVVDFNA